MVFDTKHYTVEERKFHNDLVHVVGCVACRVGHHCHGANVNSNCSIHHIDGRKKAYSHWYVLPLCAGHHQKGTNTDNPEMLAIHGNKVDFEAKYGTQDDLWLHCFEVLEYIPDGVRDWLMTTENTGEEIKEDELEWLIVRPKPEIEETHYLITKCDKYRITKVRPTFDTWSYIAWWKSPETSYKWTVLMQGFTRYEQAQRKCHVHFNTPRDSF